MTPRTDPVVAFQDAMARVTGGTRHRSLVRSNLDALLATLLFVAATLGSTLIAGVAAFLNLGQGLPNVEVVNRALGLAFGVVPYVDGVVAVAVVYRIVPLPHPAWRSLVVPGVVIGLVLSGLLQLFVYVAPRLIGAAALLGTLASLFALLAWLSLSFQALLLGAAWTAEREVDRATGAIGADSPV
jgi:uncharacterized BrkB/YihY/UPF0761 family membrane protein